MEESERTIQNAIKAACSISYVSEKLGISRPTFYKYMEQYDAGDTERIPQPVRDFFTFVSERDRAEEDVILYFIRGEDGGDGDVAPSDLETKVVSEPGRAMIVFPRADPENTVVDLMMDFNGRKVPIATYRPLPNVRFVTIDGLVSGQTFYYEVRSGNLSSGIRGFEIVPDRQSG